MHICLGGVGGVQEMRCGGKERGGRKGEGRCEEVQKKRESDEDGMGLGREGKRKRRKDMV